MIYFFFSIGVGQSDNIVEQTVEKSKYNFNYFYIITIKMYFSYK